MRKSQEEVLRERNFALGEMRSLLQQCEQKMAFIIGATPSDSDRNALSTINIDLMRLEEKYLRIVSYILNARQGAGTPD
jgi:hypothetical protein